MRTLHAFCAAVFGLIGHAMASPPLDITEYSHTSFTPAQGAPMRGALLAQTSDGFLWLGTAVGLYRFDGVRFEHIAAVRGIPLLGEFITALEAPQSGGLWIGYQYGGASFLDGRGLRNYPPEIGGLARGTLESFAVDPDGVVWAGSTRALARLDGQHWTDVSQTIGLPAPSATNLMVDRSGDLWIESADKLALLRRGSSKVHVYELPAYQGLVRDPEGRVWNMVGQPNCLYLLDPTRDDIPPCRSLPRAYTDLWLIDRAGNLWASDQANRLSVIPIASLDRAAVSRAGENKPEVDPLFWSFNDRAEPVSVLQDREGNVWFGTTGGLEQLRVPRLRRHGPFEEFVVLGAGEHNSLWVATTHYRAVPADDFFELKDGRMVPYHGGPTQITASHRDATGTLWMGGYGRLWKLNAGKWEEVAAPSRELANADSLRRTQAIALDGRGDLWLSVVRVGLFRLRNRQWERVLVPGIPPSDYPFVMYADADGSVWLGYGQGRLASLKSDTWKLYTEKDGIAVGSVQVLCGINGELWIGGEHGLQRIRNEHVESIQGLRAVGNVTGLLHAKNGDLWMSASIGGVRVARGELARPDLASAQTLAFEKLDALDGMPGPAAGIRPMPTVLETDDGHIWFESDDRFSSIDPSEHIKNTVAPNVMIGGVTDDARRREPAASLTLFPNVRNVAIDYTATGLSIPSRVRFKYRLENFDDDWQDVGTRRTAYYNNLPPGRYVFQVIAANEDDVWNSQGAEISLTVPPIFYQTIAFRVAVLTLGILLAAALFLIRLRQVTTRERRRLEQRMEDRFNERTRIARELHDSLLQGFQGLMFRLQAVRQLLPGRPGDAARSLESALHLGDQAIVEGRDAVENLRAASFDERDLAASLQTLGAELCVEIEQQPGPHYGLVVEGRARQLAPAVRDEAYRIVREAARNAYQHANAQNIETEVTFGDAIFSIRVRDDGVGIDLQILARGRRPGHWGLPGMRERSESLGAQLNVWSETNAGTEVELRLPADIAYAEPRRSLLDRLKNLLRTT